MKTRAILLLLICLNCTAFAQRNNPVITSFGKINLDGHWKGDDFGDEGDHRSIPYIPVIASLEKDILILEFMEVGSDITVTIVGKNQILLSHSLLIDILGNIVFLLMLILPEFIYWNFQIHKVDISMDGLN